MADWSSRDRPTVPVAVIIPGYNVADTIAETLQSVFAQTVLPIEIILVDDGSTDNTAEVARANGATVISQPNSGVSAARNAGVAGATAQWVAFLDGDDLWAPQKLERQFNAVRADLQSKVAFCDFWEFDASRCINRSVAHERFGSLKEVRKTAIDQGVWRCNSDDLSRMTTRQFIMLPSTILVDREYLQSVGGWEENISFCEDVELAHRLLARSTALFIDSPLMGYRKHKGNATTNRLRIRKGDVAVLNRVSTRPHEYLASTVNCFRESRSLILLKAGRMAVMYNKRKLARVWLCESWQLEKRFSTFAWMILSHFCDNKRCLRATRALENAWFAYRTFRTRSHS